MICINSTFWDISRWEELGSDIDRFGKPYYPILEQNVKKLCEHINQRELARVVQYVHYLVIPDHNLPCRITAVPINLSVVKIVFLEVTVLNVHH